MMVKITSDMLLRHASHAKKRSNETEMQFYRRLTHIYLQERNIDEIDNLQNCKNLSVLYLYDNEIMVIKNLSFATNLTHLYLQKNKIQSISDMKYLPRLTKLYLGQNSITVVEGLAENTCLVELHIESQHLPLGEKLLFDPRTMEAISKSLSVLNVSNNNIDEISDLQVLRRLNHLQIENNKLHDWSDLSNALLEWPSLFHLDVQGNPICEQKKFRDKLIIISKSLVMIDNKEVSESTRQFLQNWYANKKAKKRLKKQLKRDSESYEAVMTDSVHDSNRLQMNYPYGRTSLYKLDNQTNGHYNFQLPLSSKHLSRNHKQFVDILAKAADRKILPPLEQVQARYANEHVEESPIV